MHASLLTGGGYLQRRRRKSYCLLENVVFKENAEATLYHRAEPRQLEAGGAARGGGAVQEGD